MFMCFLTNGMIPMPSFLNVEARSAVADRGDTIIVLSPFVDDTILYINDTTVVRKGKQFYLPDLLPGYVMADSVEINAMDLSARGMVRVGINNRSDVAVDGQFLIVLFEDLDGDFQYNRTIDKRIGQAYVQGVGANEIKLYQIDIEDTLSFPNRAIFAFVDASDWIVEYDEWNNVKSSGTSCEDFMKTGYVCPEPPDAIIPGMPVCCVDDSMTAGLPEMRDTTLFCYLYDSNGDSIVDDNDSLCIVYIYDYKLHAVNAHTHDSLFPPLQLNGLLSMKLVIDDFTGDGKPQIVADSIMYNNDGSVLFDATLFDPSSSVAQNQPFDFNRDGDRDTIIYVDDECCPDSCVTIRSGRDSTLLYVNPLDKWKGPYEADAKNYLADIVKGEYFCYDVNVSFPRYSVVSGDTVDITIRAANAGAGTVNRLKVEVFADTSDSAAPDMPQNVIKMGETTIDNSMLSQKYQDIRFEMVLPGDVKRVWFVVDGDNRFFECCEKDNVISFELD